MDTSINRTGHYFAFGRSVLTGESFPFNRKINGIAEFTGLSLIVAVKTR